VNYSIDVNYKRLAATAAVTAGLAGGASAQSDNLQSMAALQNAYDAIPPGQIYVPAKASYGNQGYKILTEGGRNVFVVCASDDRYLSSHIDLHDRTINVYGGRQKVSFGTTDAATVLSNVTYHVDYSRAEGISRTKWDYVPLTKEQVGIPLSSAYARAADHFCQSPTPEYAKTLGVAADLMAKMARRWETKTDDPPTSPYAPTRGYRNVSYTATASPKPP
jgi:hypothetical protein